MADDKDTYVQGRGNPSLDPTRTDLQARRDALFKSAFTHDKRGMLVETSKLDAQNAAIDAREKSAFSLNRNGLLTRTSELEANNATLDAMKASSFGTNINGLLTRKSELEANNATLEGMKSLNGFGSKESIQRSFGTLIPKTEQVPPQRDLSGGGAKSGIRRSKKISSYGRGDPTFKKYNPKAFQSGFFRAAVASAKHFIPQYGLFGTGFHGGAIRIQPMRWEGAFPVMDIQQWDSAGATTSYTEEEEDDE